MYLTIGNNDGDENPFDFTIAGKVLPLPTFVPEIQILDDQNNDITDGTTTALDFGTTPVTEAVSKIFTIENLGNAVLNLSGWKLPDGFSFASNLPGTIDPGASATLNIEFDPTTAGTFQGTISIGNNDGDENPFDFPVKGDAFLAPEVEVIDTSNNNIADGTTTPIDVGTTPFGVPVSEVFTIRNNGSGPLDMSQWKLPNGFSFVGTPPSNLGTGSITNLEVKLDAKAVGDYAGDLSFDNNDTDENPFNFAIKGTVTPPSVTISVSDGNLSENVGSPGEFTVTLNSPAPAGGVTVNFSTSGSAIFGAPTGNDYNLLGTGVTVSGTAGSVIVPANTTTAKIRVEPIDDFRTSELDETIILMLIGASAGFTVGTPSSDQMAIKDNDWDGVSATSSLSGGNGADKIHGNDNGVDTITPSGSADIIAWSNVPSSGIQDRINGFATGQDKFQFATAKFGNISSVSSVTVMSTGAGGTNISGKNLIVFDSSITIASIADADSKLSTQNGTSAVPAFFIYTSGPNWILGYDPVVNVSGNAVSITQLDGFPTATNFTFV